MCFELGSCFGKARTEDFGRERSTPKTARGGRRRADHHNIHYRGNDHKAPAPPYSQQPHVAVGEAGHKAYHEGARKDHRVAAAADGHGGYAAYVQDKQADNDTPKLPAAWHNKVGHDAGYTYTYTARLDEAAADPREKATMDYHHYLTANTDTTLVRY